MKTIYMNRIVMQESEWRKIIILLTHFSNMTELIFWYSDFKHPLPEHHDEVHSSKFFFPTPKLCTCNSMVQNIYEQICTVLLIMGLCQSIRSLPTKVNVHRNTKSYGWIWLDLFLYNPWREEKSCTGLHTSRSRFCHNFMHFIVLFWFKFLKLYSIYSI